VIMSWLLKKASVRPKVDNNNKAESFIFDD
jgi:hypothetical protein